MPDAYFTTADGAWFRPTELARGPWDPHACHAGPPAALMVRSLEALVTDKPLARLTVELMRPIPVAGFRVQAEIRRPGRSVTLTSAEILDDDRIYAQAFGMHLRRLDDLAVRTARVDAPDFAVSTPGPFPIRQTTHGLPGFVDSIEVRYDPAGSQAMGGPTVVWIRAKVPFLADEEPSPFQRLCPLADSGNGISWNEYLDKVLFLNPDLNLSVHRHPVGEWFCSRVVSHWHRDGTGLSDAELFDVNGPVGRAVQNLLLEPA